MLIGNIGRDATFQTLSNGKKVINFSVAVTESYKNKEGQKVENTTWYSCAQFYDKETSLHNYLLKGTKVFVEGVLKPTIYFDGNGKPLIDNKLAIMSNGIRLLSSAPKPENNQGQQPKTQTPPSIPSEQRAAAGDTDDLPF